MPGSWPIPSSIRRTLRSRVLAFTETGKARASGPPRNVPGADGQAVEPRRPGPPRDSGRSRANSSSPASPVKATVTSLRVSRETYQVGRPSCRRTARRTAGQAGKVSQAFGARRGTRGARCRGASRPARRSGSRRTPGRRTDREGLHRSIRRPLHQADDDRRVDPAREESAERNVGDHLLANRVVERSPGALRRPRREGG